MTEPTGQSARNKVRSCPDLEFGRLSGHTLLLDLYIPIGVPAPAIVLYLHGGGWMSGSRKGHADRAIRLAENGIAVACIDYRFSVVAPFPAQIVDVAAAIEWVRGPGQAFDLDSNRLALWGASAGAHLAFLFAASEPIPTVGRESPGSATTVKALVGMFGNYDLTSRGDLDRPYTLSPVPDEVLTQEWPTGTPLPPSSRYLRSRLLGIPEAALDDRALALVSPLIQAHTITAPAFLLHGTHDSVTSVEQSRRMAHDLRSRGNAVRLELIDGANHEDPIFDSPETIAGVANFLNEHLPIISCPT